MVVMDELVIYTLILLIDKIVVIGWQKFLR